MTENDVLNRGVRYVRDIDELAIFADNIYSNIEPVTIIDRKNNTYEKLYGYHFSIPSMKWDIYLGETGEYIPELEKLFSKHRLISIYKEGADPNFEAPICSRYDVPANEVCNITADVAGRFDEQWLSEQCWLVVNSSRIHYSDIFESEVYSYSSEVSW